MSDKKDQSHTLARFFGNDEVPTGMIEVAKQYAHRQLGRVMGRPVINALDRLLKKKQEGKK